MNNKKALIIDDEAQMGNFLSEAIALFMYDALSVQEVSEFKVKFEEEFDLIIVDLLLKGSDGIELLRFMAERNCKSDIILISGVDGRTLHTAEKIGIERGLNIIGTLTKPIHLKDIGFLLTNTPNKEMSRQQRNEISFNVDELDEAITNKEIIVYYQPQINIMNNSVHGFEALSRWIHPRLGFIPPDKFIAVAEKHGLIQKLTEHVLVESLETGKWLKELGYEIGISINFSALNLQDLEIPEKILSYIQKYNLSPQKVMIELTESKLFENITNSMDILTRLNLKGIGLSIDDYGTGYSSMQQLRNLPFNELKIDRSFIKDCKENKESSTIVDSTIKLAHNLRMKVVAEGVEDEETLKYLRELNCDIVQGYFYSKAIPKMEIIEFLNRFRFD